ncbi:hypothetical protein [Natronosalvus amylolyticus]|uniref:hypothetical protein n=1 Tax=Natronosalvus amylolyticus TaxID=2961994 RepID=UPI0020C9D10E|nr:hypothetical protein [Natronosalvus amylolyticus]
MASLDRDAEIQLEGVLEPADFVIVTACSETPASTELAKQVCEKIDEDQQSVVIVLRPETNSIEQYPGLNEAAENIIPIDESHATEICNPNRLLETKRSSPLDPGEQVMVALIDAFVRTLHGPLPIGTDLAALHELFTDRGHCRLYYGAGHRGELPATVIDGETSGWLSDGRLERADGAFGFVRFGSPFELREFEIVEEHLKDQYASQTIPKNRWVVTGTSDELFLEEFSVLLVIFGEE